MKCIYLKPQIKVLCIHLNSFLAISNQGGQTEYIGDNPEGGSEVIGGGDTPPNPQGGGGGGSRSWEHRSLWDDMK